MQKSKICSRCKKDRPLECFYTSSSQKSGYQAYCKECNKAHMNSLYPTLDIEKRRMQSRRVMLKSKYNISLELYEKLLQKQNGVCAICEKPETARSNKKGPVDSLRVDHCHTTGKIRGLLCSECNFGISKFDDSLNTLFSAVIYILKFKQGFDAFGVLHEKENSIIHEEERLKKKKK